MEKNALFEKYNAIFQDMKVGQVLIVDQYAPNHPDKFIAYVKEFIDEGYSLEFSNDYKLVRKINSIPA